MLVALIIAVIVMVVLCWLVEVSPMQPPNTRFVQALIIVAVGLVFLFQTGLLSR